MFADVTFSAESLAVVVTLVVALTGAVAALYRELRAAAQAQLAEMRSQRDSYKEIAEEALESIEKIARIKWQSEGGKVPDPLAPVIPEHHSPTTEKQRDTASLQTMRARLVAATLALGLPPRRATRPATEREERDGRGGLWRNQGSGSGGQK